MKSNDVESGTNELSFLFQVFFMNLLPQAHKTTLKSFKLQNFADIFASKVHHRWQIRHLCQLHLQIATNINDTNGKFATGVHRHRWKILETLSACVHIKSELEEKNLSTTERCLNKIIKNFEYARAFPFPTGVNTPSGAPGAANISVNFLKKLKRH